MATQLFWRATHAGTTITVRRTPRNRFTIHVAREGVPGRARVFLALSARHVAALLRSLICTQRAAPAAVEAAAAAT